MAETNIPRKHMDEKDLEPVVTGSTKTKKRGLKRWRDVFIAVNRDEFESSFTSNLLYPACRELVVRLAHGAIDILFNGGNPNSYYHTSDKMPYYRISQRDSIMSQKNQSIGKTAAGYSLDDVGYDTYAQADAVLQKINYAISEYGVVDVYAFYIWSDVQADFTDKAWGWEEIVNCKPLLRRDGKYFLPLPRPKRISQR